MAGVTIMDAWINVVPSMAGITGKLNKQISGVGDQVGTKLGSEAGHGFSKGLLGVGAIVGAAAQMTQKAMSAISSSIGSAVSRADQMNNFPKVMANLGYSSEDASNSIKKIGKALDGLPTSSAVMSGMVQQLAPLTSSLDEATTISLALNDAMLAGGASTMEQENALTQYTQMLSAGTVDMQAWRSIQAAMPGQLNQVAEALLGAGKNGNDLYAAMKKGKVSFSDFNKAIVDLDKNGFGQYASFAQQAKDATQGIGTAIENMHNRIAKAVQKVIEAVGVSNISGAINAFSSQFGKIGDAAADVTVFVKDSFADMWGKIVQTGAIANIKTVLEVLVNTFRSINWKNLIPPDVFDRFSWAVANAMSIAIDGIANLLAIIGEAVKAIARFVQSFAATGAFQAWIEVLNMVVGLVRDVVVAIARIIAKFVELATHGKDASDFGTSTGNAFKVIAEAVKPVIKALDDVVNWAANHAGTVVTAIKLIGAAMLAVKGYQAITSGLNGIAKAAQAVGGTASGISKTVEFINEMGGLGATLKHVASNLNIVKAAQAAWNTITTAAMAVQGAFNAVMSANPIALVVIAITALIAALVLFFTKTELGRQMWSSFISWLQQAWQAVSTFFIGLWDGIVQVFQDAVQSVQAAWSSVTSFFANLWNSIVSGVQSAWSAIANVFTTVGQGIQNAVATVWTAIGTLILTPIQLVQNGINNVFGWILGFITSQMESTSGVMQTAWTGIYNIVNGVWTAIGTVIQTVINYMRTIIVAVLDLIKGDWQGAWNTVSSFFQATWNGIVSFLAPVIEGVKTTIGNALNAISTWWNSVWTAISTFFSNIWNGIVSAVTQKVNAVSNVIRSVCSAVSSWWNGIWNAISGFLFSVWNGMVSAVSNRINAVRNTISSVLNAIRGVWNSVWNGISGFLGGIWNGMVNVVGGAIGRIGGQVGRIYGLVTGALSGAGGWLYGAGRNIVQGLINGIGGAFGWLRRTIMNLGSSVVGWAKSVLGIHSPSRVFRDEIGQNIAKGMGLGIERGQRTVHDAMSSLYDEIDPSKTDTGVNVTARGTYQLAYDDEMQLASRGQQLSKQDMLEALREVWGDGVTLHLNDRGGEVMAGKLAKPMADEFEKRTNLGR
nr:MAG TPA: tail tape measure [Caudoviricetes sp.]